MVITISSQTYIHTIDTKRLENGLNLYFQTDETRFVPNAGKELKMTHVRGKV